MDAPCSTSGEPRVVAESGLEVILGADENRRAATFDDDRL